MGRKNVLCSTNFDFSIFNIICSKKKETLEKLLPAVEIGSLVFAVKF
jgi:hypothetical protein